MKKILLSTLIVVVIAAMTACGGGGGDDLDSLIEKQISIMEDLASDVESADNAAEMAEALNKATAELKILAASPAIEELKKLKNIQNPSEIPEEITKHLPKLMEAGMKLFGAMNKINQFQEDPMVKEALQKFQEVGKEANLQ
jgi:short-subunit dehydrogenase involved in D-alanine esterification of teichoic acids